MCGLLLAFVDPAKGWDTPGDAEGVWTGARLGDEGGDESKKSLMGDDAGDDGGDRSIIED